MISSETRNLIRDFYNKIKNYKKDLSKELEARKKDRDKIAQYLKKDVIKNLDEFEIGQIISNLWTTEILGNKDYKIKTIIEANGLSKLKNELYELLYGDKNIEIRFDKFRKEIKYLGTASITEILCIFDPQNYVIWNDKARNALKKLKVEHLPINKYFITGKEYIEIIKTYKEILNELKELKFPELDLLGVDYFLYQISIYKEEEIFDEDFNHDEIRDKISEIGEWLGFETFTEEIISKGARVDVIWRAKIANLGVVTYVFEVHRKGSIDSLILNLQKALNNPTVQKLIVATNRSQIEIIKNEINTLPENFRKLLTFWNVREIIETHENLSKVIENIKNLSLLKSQFEEKM